MAEQDLYAPVRDWLRDALGERFGPRGRVRAVVSADRHLSSVLEEWGLADAFQAASTFEIRVDVAATAVGREGHPLLFLVEVKARPTNLAA
ncbi:MAG: hypothetical protein N2512_04315, partial [Armatimonadetes bacterium]|nr:hypothetical protein [Armatimonadota bacterium]